MLQDVEQVGVQTIARFLIILSALRYPRLDESELDAQRLARVNRLLLASLTAALPQLARENDTLAYMDPGTVNVAEIHSESMAEQDGVQL